ncbi:MAG: cbb3-type cytochrome oxidase assembly protein CcoS [Gammaproteobacteria bacterium]|jgi:cbb3-type cytochrome oxidase maturation protein|nr:cbb3-type cytochrome oxidase assembly protein CcoS [Gammaproteobacteria bacterium]
MEVLYLLIPIALLLVGLVAVALLWAVRSGQFDDLEGPAHRILMDDEGVAKPASGEDPHRQADKAHRREADQAGGEKLEGEDDAGIHRS